MNKDRSLQGRARHRPALYGFTLIELLVFVVVVSVGLAGILVVMNTVVKSSADPLARKQALALAESVLEEVLHKAYADPDGTADGELGHDTWDNVDDYQGQTKAAWKLPASLSAYTVRVLVRDDITTLGILAKQVTVTVASPVESVTLIGYRTNDSGP
ncbi:MAG: prepilin-type cleavage/methylation domain-containing protein [Rhodoferax sp.]|nr:prepilin-type cleavage/methylation domain-containing protein [Rhodoferax sp.]